MDRRKLIDFCRDLPPFASLSESDLNSLIDSCRCRSFAQKEYIFFEGDQGDAGYLVLSGRVAMVKNSPRGREMIMELLPAGELFGLVVFIDDRPYPLTARAQSEVEVLVLPKAIVLSAIRSNSTILQGFLTVVSNRLQTAHNVARSLAHDKVEVRIASTLLALVEKGKAAVAIGRQELADLTGTTIESASRVCKLWERDGILDLSHLGVVNITQPKALQSFVDEAAS